MHKIASNALRLCFKLLLPCPQIGNNAWEWSYGKHDEQEFTRLNIAWAGTILDRIFWIAIIWVGIFPVGVIVGGSYPGWEFSGWELPWVGIVRVSVILDDSFLWWGFSGWELSGGNHPGGKFSGRSFPSTKSNCTQGEIVSS